MQTIIFTDLDGTLLDNSYSWEKASKAINLIKKKKIPLVFCTSKTQAETIYWQKKLKIKDPFIVENGGAIIIPKGYFGNKKKRIIKLGDTNKKLKIKLKNIEKETKSEITCLTDMSISDLINYSGLSRNQALMAKKRKYISTFIVQKGSIKKIKALIKKNKLNYTKGSLFHHIMKGNDKGKAVKILIKEYEKKYGKVISIGLGDNLNDKPMLKVVDKAFMLKKGPSEWNKIILKILS